MNIGDTATDTATASSYQVSTVKILSSARSTGSSTCFQPSGGVIYTGRVNKIALVDCVIPNTIYNINKVNKLKIHVHDKFVESLDLDIDPGKYTPQTLCDYLNHEIHDTEFKEKLEVSFNTIINRFQIKVIDKNGTPIKIRLDRDMGTDNIMGFNIENNDFSEVITASNASELLEPPVISLSISTGDCVFSGGITNIRSENPYNPSFDLPLALKDNLWRYDSNVRQERQCNENINMNINEIKLCYNGKVANISDADWNFTLAFYVRLS
jgi:hypothetical protein